MSELGTGFDYGNQPALFVGFEPKTTDPTFGAEAFLDTYGSCLDPDGDAHDEGGIDALLASMPRERLDEYFQTEL